MMYSLNNIHHRKSLPEPGHVWNSIRFQLGGGLLIAVLLPCAVRIRFQWTELRMESFQASVIGTALALIVGFYSFRRLSHYPGVRASYHILPSFVAAYGLVMVLFFFSRLDYSRAQFLSSFFICISWYYAIYFKLQHRRRMRIGIIPFGEVDSLVEIEDVHWVVLNEPVVALTEPVDVIVADLRADIPSDWERLLADRALSGTLVMHVKQIQESLTGCVAIEHLSENIFGSLVPGPVYGKVKRAGDLIISLLALPLLIPITLGTALAICIDSKGPVLFIQERVGHRGQSFRMYKFRSMRHSDGLAEDPRSASVTRDADARVTRVGRFIRRYRLDELPQVLNVILGQMSWIGPRPEAVPLSLWYEVELPHYRYRHIVLPGITGWAQVKQGHVSEVDEVMSKLHYDFYYIKNFSFWLDLLIIARTIRTVLNGFGSR